MENFLRDGGKKEVGGKRAFLKIGMECVGIIQLAAVERYDRGDGKNEESQKTEENEIQAYF